MGFSTNAFTAFECCRCTFTIITCGPLYCANLFFCIQFLPCFFKMISCNVSASAAGPASIKTTKTSTLLSERAAATSASAHFKIKCQRSLFVTLPEDSHSLMNILEKATTSSPSNVPAHRRNSIVLFYIRLAVETRVIVPKIEHEFSWTDTRGAVHQPIHSFRERTTEEFPRNTGDTAGFNTSRSTKGERCLTEDLFSFYSLQPCIYLRILDSE